MSVVTHELAVPAASDSPSVWRVVRASLPIVWSHRGWWAAVAAIAVLYAALEPVQAVVIKRVVAGLQAKAEPSSAVVLRAIPRYVMVLMGLAVLSFIEKCLKGFYDPHLVFELQRRYLERRTSIDIETDVSRLQYDCMYGRKALEVFARDLWQIAVTIVSVFAFQQALAPEWLPALALLTGTLIGLVLVFGVKVTTSNQAMFDAIEPVAHCAAPDRLSELKSCQQTLYGRIKWREAWMGASEVSEELVLRSGCLAVLGVASYWPGLLGLSARPDATDASDLALFVVNVQIISRPLLESGKSYNKFCSNIAALRRTLFPQSAA